MEIKIRIKTPKGHAKKVEQRLRHVLLGNNKPKEMFTNQDDDELYWVVELPIRKALRVQKNIAAFDTIINSIFNSKLLKKHVIDKRMLPGQKEELKKMLLEHTEIEVIKKATADEIIDNKTFWERVKEKFKRETIEG